MGVKILKEAGELLFVFLFFALLTITFNLPVVIDLKRVLVNFPFETSSTDYGQFIWNFWWTKKALIDLRANPYFTDQMFYPGVTGLAFSTMSFYNSFLALPLLYFLSPVKVYNLLYLSTFILTGVFTYCLIKYLTGDRLAALAGGLIFSFCVFHMYRYQHINITTYYWIPVYVLSLYKLKDRGGAGYIFLTAFSLAMACSCHWNQMVFLFFFSALFVLYHHKETLAKPFITRLVLASALFLAVISPEAYPLVKALVSRSDSYIVAPTNLFREQLTGRLINGEIYIWPLTYGYTAVALALISPLYIRKRETGKDVAFWGMVTGFFFLMTLGPNLVVNNKPYGPAMLPFGWFNHIPVLNGVRFPERYIVMVQMGTACLAAFAVSNIAKRQGLRFLYYVVIILVLLEMSPGIQTRWAEIRVPKFYNEMAADKDSYAVVESPLLYYDGTKLFYQAVHNKKLVNGYISHGQSIPRETLAFIHSNPLLDAMSNPFSDCRLTEAQVRAEARKLGDDFGVRYLVFNKDLQYSVRSPWDSEPGAAPPGYRFFPWDTRELVDVRWDTDRLRGKRSGLPGLMKKSLGKAYYEDDDVEVYKLASY